MDIVLNGITFQLLSQKAVYQADEELLIIADVHLGKARHFMRSGVNLTHKAQQSDYQNLAQLFFSYQPKKVYFLGDLFHSSINADWMHFENLINAFSAIEFTLIKGNHDLIPTSFFTRLNVNVINETLETEQFIFSHHPLSITTDKIVFCGHIHPAVRLQGKARQSVLLPCFHYSAPNFLLPSFGRLTGSYIIRQKRNEKVFIVVGNEVKML